MYSPCLICKWLGRGLHRQKGEKEEDFLTLYGFVLVSSSEDGPCILGWHGLPVRLPFSNCQVKAILQVAMKIALAQQSPTNVLVKCYQCAMIILIPICEKIFICVYLPLSADKINFSAQTFAYFKKILYLCTRNSFDPYETRILEFGSHLVHSKHTGV